MTTYIVAALAAVALAAGGWAVWQDGRADRFQAEAKRLERELAASREVMRFKDRARAIAESARIEAEERNRLSQRTIEILLTGDFEDADTPIDPRIADLLACLREGNRDCGGAAGNPGGPSGP